MNNRNDPFRNHLFRNHLSRNTLFAALLSLGVLNAASVIAQDKDVDQADSLDFESFHKDKKAAVKVWKEGEGSTSKTAPVKTYEQSPAANSTVPANTAAPANTATSTTAPAAEKAPISAGTSTAKPAEAVKPTEAVKEGQRYEIRERYTLTRSTKTPYSAFYVIEPLYKQSAQLCARGWKKLSERSEPIEQDFYLYYEIECL